MDIKGKKITVLGAYRSGIGAAKLALRKRAIPFVSDMAPYDKLEDNFRYLQELGIPYEYENHTEKVFDAEIIITSPGVPTKSDVMMKASFLKKRVISEVEFASWFCKGNIISITGTNGKTTTTSLCEHVLKGAGIKARSAGNIGLAFSEVAHRIRKGEYVVLETSSFQLDFIEKFKPRFSVILNITPDHLDRYNGSFEEYKNSKLKVIQNQDEKDYFISNADDPNIPEEIKNKSVNHFYFSTRKTVNNGAYYMDGKFYFAQKGAVKAVCSVDSFSLAGEHNLSNALAVITIAKILGVPHKIIEKRLSNFPGVEHRLEFVRELYGVKYINDSKATNVDSVWYALRSFQDPILLILGGKDKGNDYSKIERLVKENVKKIYAIGSSAEKVYGYFNKIVPVEIISSLEETVEKAKKEASYGDVVLLSPACASFDMFDNYEHRGEVFKYNVKKLS